MAEDTMSKIGFVLIEGWLVKSPPIHKIKNIKSWHRRYFALIQINRETQDIPKNWSKKGPKMLEDLHDFYLVYWQSKKSRNKGLKPIRTIPIFNGFTVEKQKPPCFVERFQFVLALNTVERKFYLCANDELSMMSWLEYLTHAIDVVAKFAHEGERIVRPLYESLLEVIPYRTESQSTTSSTDLCEGKCGNHEDEFVHGDPSHFNNEIFQNACKNENRFASTFDIRKPRSRTVDAIYTPGSIPNLFRHNSDSIRFQRGKMMRNARYSNVDLRYYPPRRTLENTSDLSPSEKKRYYSVPKSSTCKCYLGSHLSSNERHFYNRLSNLHIDEDLIPANEKEPYSKLFDIHDNIRSKEYTDRISEVEKTRSNRVPVPTNTCQHSNSPSPRAKMKRGESNESQRTKIMFHDIGLDLPSTSSIELANECLHIKTGECSCIIQLVEEDERKEVDKEVEDYGEEIFI